MQSQPTTGRPNHGNTEQTLPAMLGCWQGQRGRPPACPRDLHLTAVSATLSGAQTATPEKAPVGRNILLRPLPFLLTYSLPPTVSSALLLPLLKSLFLTSISLSLTTLIFFLSVSPSYLSFSCGLFSTSSIPGDHSLPARSNAVHGKQLKRHMVFLSKDFLSEEPQERRDGRRAPSSSTHTHTHTPCQTHTTPESH